ncbi:MAG: FlgD immunoglobulin-like domain containing protein [Candidatus Eiseniibacteriota bacterium]
MDGIDVLRSLAIAVGGLLVAGPASADRFAYEPISDVDDGEFIDGVSWDWKPLEITQGDILINLGREGAFTFDNAFAFDLSDLSEGQTVSSAWIRMNQQGGTITSGLSVQITAALDIDPVAITAPDRFALPRTTSAVIWNIAAPWDSSSQIISKYEETPDLAALINEVVAQPGWGAGPKDIVLFLEVLSAVGDNVVRHDDTHAAYWELGNAGIRPATLIVNETFRDGFHGKELLCRPKPTSMEVNVIPRVDTEAFVEWGTDGITFPSSSATDSITAGAAHHFVIGGLSPDTRIWYRLNAKPAGAGSFEAGPVRSFMTMPVAGQQARVCVTSDIHVTNQLSLNLTTMMDLLDTTLAYMSGYLAPESYHLWMDLGDLVVIRAQRICFDPEEVEQRYRTAREYVDRVAHSLPFVLVRGNHEEVNGWDDDGTPNTTAVWSGQMLLKYFPPPLPDEFYSGNDVPYPNLGLPGNYFAFDAGALRIRAVDPYLFSQDRPHNGHGEVGGTKDCWDWTLGQQQYDWLQEDLSSNIADFSLLAVHHLTSCYPLPGDWYGRGGIEVAKFAVDGRPSFEWGGEDSTGAHVYETQRSGFAHGATHDMLAAYGNQVVIKGHDHFHARQSLDGMVYLTLAKPDATEEQTGNLWGWWFNTFYYAPGSVFRESSGFYSVVVDDTLATYSYIQTYPSAGLGTVRDLFTLTQVPTGAGIPLPERPTATWIEMVAPNPSTAPGIRWNLGKPGHVELALYDTTGRRVRSLVSGRKDAGVHETAWDGCDESGRRVATGVYFAKLEADGRLDAVKVVLLR